MCCSEREREGVREHVTTNYCEGVVPLTEGREEGREEGDTGHLHEGNKGRKLGGEKLILGCYASSCFRCTESPAPPCQGLNTMPQFTALLYDARSLLPFLVRMYTD